jgi:phospholipid transport system substrate-binding protein
MTKQRFILVLAALVLGLTAGAAPALAGPGTAAVKKANQTVSRLLRKKAEPGSAAERKQAARVTAELRDFLDVDELGKRALVDHWDKLEPAKRKEFMSLLRQLIEANYVKGLRANLDYKVKYTGEQKKGKHLLVSTKVEAKRRGRPYVIEIEYLLRKDGGSWRTFDVLTDGVGLVENYRAMFNKIIARDGFDGLVQRMQKKLDKMGS